MTHLIDKDTVITEIDKFMYGANLEADIASTGECFNEKIAEAKYQLCKQIKDKINSLEIKEVDLEKELENLLEKEKTFVTDNREVKYYNGDSYNHIYELEFIAMNNNVIEIIKLFNKKTQKEKK